MEHFILANVVIIRGDAHNLKSNSDCSIFLKFELLWKIPENTYIGILLIAHERSGCNYFVMFVNANIVNYFAHVSNVSMEIPMMQ